MKVEGQVRIPSGCAIAAVVSKEGNRMSGEMIYNAMKPMHDRSNGLGCGLAGYGNILNIRNYTHYICFLTPAQHVRIARYS